MAASVKPSLSQTDVIKLASYYGISSYMINKIEEFDSYDDQVFHVDVKPKYCTKNVFSVIIKCTILRDINRIDLWIKLANHLLEYDIPTPKPILLLKKYTKDHPYIYIMHKNNINVKVHCTKYIKGKLADNIKHTVMFLNDLGGLIGKIHKTLLNNKFNHPYGSWEDEWCLSCTDKAINQIPNLSLLLDDDTKKLKLVKQYLNYFNLLLKPKMKYMPKCIILGDINDTNIICDTNTDNPQIISIFDFGESHYTCRVFEIAITCAYFINNKSINYGISTMLCIIKAYHKILPLTTNEIDTIFIAICSRLLVSAVLGIKNAKDNPQNPWLLHHATPSWNTLSKYSTFHPKQMATIIRKHLHNSSL